MSPDLVNVTEDRLVNPTNTLNKYVYGGNNPLEFIDPDGRDITIFYDQGGAAGHIVLLAYNQQTGDTAAQSFGEANHGIGTKLAMIFALPVAGQDNYALDNVTSADQLRQQYASITIQTNPEEAQETINYIRAHPDGKYTLFWNNCTTTCTRILRHLKFTTVHDFAPAQFFQDLQHQYGNNNTLIRNGFSVHNGVDYGRPRWGFNAFDLLYLYSQQQKENPHATHRIIYPPPCSRPDCNTTQ